MKRILLGLSVAFLSLASSAQLLNIRIGSDPLIEDAVKGAFYIAESKYFIKDVNSGQKYGRGGKTYFNQSKALACRTSDGFFMVSSALQPWNDDPQFAKYKSNDNFEPVLNDTIDFVSLDGKNQCAVLLNDNVESFEDNQIVCVGDTVRSDGLSISSETSELNWIIWVKETNDGYTFSIIKKTLDLTQHGPVMLDNPDMDKNVLGGIYISANVINVGMVDFSISGFMVKEGRKWKVLPVNESLKNNENETPEQEVTIGVTVVEEPSDELTPVNNSEISE